MAKTILIIEDEVHVGNYLQDIFQDHGYQTITASDGDQGYQLLASQKPDLITLDLQMPQGHGTKFYQKLRGDQELSKIPIVVITGQPSPHRALQPAKVAAIVNKPFEPDQLVDIVKKTIGEP